MEIKELKRKFQETFGSASKPLMFARAPGRVNLIGEHTDYNGGFVLPMGIDREVKIIFRPIVGEEVKLCSANFNEIDKFRLDDIRPSRDNRWSDYIRGAAWAMQENSLPITAFEGVLYGNVPIGAGLSSSAALEVAASLAFCGKENLKNIDKKKLALTCQKAENEFVGVNCGIMDQFVSIHAKKDHAVLIDCRSLDYSILPLNTHDVRIIVANTMVEHELGASAYNDRRSTCESAAQKLDDAIGGIKQLRDVSVEQLNTCKPQLSPIEYRRAEHVITENKRAVDAEDALLSCDYKKFGHLMNESHRSLKDDYEVSCPELDIMVNNAVKCDGVYGSRMTGAGFGGCTVSLVEAQKTTSVIESLEKNYQNQTGITPESYEFKAENGAGVDIL